MRQLHAIRVEKLKPSGRLATARAVAAGPMPDCFSPIPMQIPSIARRNKCCSLVCGALKVSTRVSLRRPAHPRAGPPGRRTAQTRLRRELAPARRLSAPQPAAADCLLAAREPACVWFGSGRLVLLATDSDELPISGLRAHDSPTRWREDPARRPRTRCVASLSPRDMEIKSRRRRKASATAVT